MGGFAENVKIPKSKAGLQRPLNDRHAFLLIEQDNVWITSCNRELAETFAALVMRGNPVTVVKTGRVIVWGIYAGQPQESGSMVLDRKSDGRFKLIPLSDTPKSLLTRIAQLVGRPGTMTSEDRATWTRLPWRTPQSSRARRDEGDGSGPAARGRARRGNAGRWIREDHRGRRHRRYRAESHHGVP